MADSVTISSDQLSATITHQGAELISLRDQQGRELMSSGDPAFWRGRAPLLFPIVGRLHNDRLTVDGAHWTMAKHGFARTSRFELIDVDDHSALFRLAANDETRAQYPFEFELDACFTLQSNRLMMVITVRNVGGAPLPFSFGFHPAFAWPLPYGGAREAHEIVFEQPEPDMLRRVTPYGTIGPDPVPSPVEGSRLELRDELFSDDALVWQTVKSRRLFYGADGYPKLDIGFPDTPSLGIWTKMGASFICVEPWAGIADPEGFTGEFKDKPGVMHVAAGNERSFRMSVALVE